MSRCASFNGRSNHEQLWLSISPWCPRPVGAPLRRHDGGKIRDSATLGRCAERAPAGIPALGPADAGNDGPDGIAQSAGSGGAAATPQIRRGVASSRLAISPRLPAVDRQLRARNGRLIQVNVAAPLRYVRKSRTLKEKADVLRQPEHAPTEDVPTSGRYELLNVFGTATGEVLYASEGERLPAAPRSYTWRLVAIDEPLEVARRRVLEAEKGITRQESLVQRRERGGHVEIAKLGRDMLRALQGSLQAANNYVKRLKAFLH